MLSNMILILYYFVYLTHKCYIMEEINEVTSYLYKGIKLQYNEVYYLDYIVDEDTGLINKDVKEKNYTKNQMDRNIKALKNEYYVVKEKLLLLNKHAEIVFDSNEDFSKWLNTPNFFFDNKKPSEFLGTISGIQFIDSRLTAMEYGDNV